MNVKTQIRIAATACAVAASGLVLADTGISTCASPCKTSSISNSVTLQVIVPETLVLKVGELSTRALNGNGEPNSSGYTSTINSEGTVITHTASNP